MNLFAIIALLGVLGQQAIADNTYSIYLPKHLRPGVPYDFVVEILNSEGTVAVEATLSSDDFTAVAQTNVESGTSATLGFKMIPYSYDGNTTFTVKVVGKLLSTGEVLFTNETKPNDIQFQKKILSIFIQTDKAIYQPSQTIKFRAVVTTSDLLPLSGTATYKLMDPSNNIIIMEKDANLNSGVVGSQFKLGKHSTLGDWKIVYQVLGFEESLIVTVEEYKLPKFSVDIKADKSYLHPGSNELSGELSAMFTFGQPVKGTARMEFTIDRWRRHDQEPEMIVHKFPEFDGSESFKIPAEQIEEILKWNPKSWSQDLKIFAVVTDKNTGDSFNETMSISLQRKMLKVEAVAHPSNIKPGLPYVAYIKVTEYDGTLLSSEDMEELQLKIEAEYSYPRNKTTGRWVPSRSTMIDIELGDDGIAVLNMVADADNFNSINFNVKVPSYPDKNEYWASWSAERFESPSDTYMQVAADDSSLTAGDIAKLTVHTTEKADSYRFVILSRGKLVKQEIVTPTEYETEEHSVRFNYQFDVTSSMSPSLYVIASFVRPDGEIVADSVKINVQASLDNEVTMTTSTDKTDAGMPVSITVKADAGSFVGLRAIDQSVLLLKEGNDITREKIFKDLEKYGAEGGWSGGYGGRWWWPYPIRGADVQEVFENSGVLVLTDALVYSSKPAYFYWPLFELGAEPEMEAAPFPEGEPEMAAVSFPEPEPGMAAIPFPEGESESAPMSIPDRPATRARSFFPESWIWAESLIGPDGSTTLTYNTPDTITTWELSSFAVSSNHGLGVTKENSKITVFRNFFISLNLPPTMVRGEILNMKTVLFNYFDTPLTVTVTLTENEWYDLILIGKDKMASGPLRMVTIPAQDSITVVFPIKFKKAGDAKIMVKATSSIAGDAVKRKLVVKPEGIPVTKSHSTVFDRKDNTEPESEVSFDVDIPKDAVEGSTHVKFTVSGNMIGNALSNLGSLLKMPSGCGEQTMLSFAPDVYVSLYLQKVGELVGEIKQKSKTHIQEGYQNELRYQRDDGSFSAFGKNDRSGSTWLTAFVVKCFIAATQLESNLVEASKIEQAVDFILGQQNEDGTFKEPGRVIHKDMQGGVESDETTAAYMLIALSEGGYFRGKDEDVKAAMDKTQEYLESRIDMIRDTYTLALVSYALSLVESQEAANLLNILDTKATTKGTVRFWEKEQVGASHCLNQKNYCPLSEEVSTSSIEITAYALLTYVKMGRKDSVMPIVRWLAQQRGAFGGYHSTQDTVMAIQALSTVAALFADRSVDMEVSVSHEGKPDLYVDFSLHDDNTLVLQMADLPSLPGKVNIKGTGIGFADVQLIVSYNLPVGPRIDEPFDVDVKVAEKKTYSDPNANVVVCSKINENREEVIDGTGMFVITVDLPSGFTIDEKEAMAMNEGIKLIELVGEEVTGYFDELPKGKTVCMNLKLIRYAEVAGIRPKIIKAFDYYKPGNAALRQYAPREEDMTDQAEVCATCGDLCVGCPPIIHIPEPDSVVPGTYCKELSAPCPQFSDGLYYDTGSHIANMFKTYKSLTSCYAPEGAGNSQTIPGIPGTMLDGSSQYIACERTPDFNMALKGGEGFTISLLMYPTEQMKSKYYTVLSIGAAGASKPYVIFAKRPRFNEYRLRMVVNEYEYIVHSIPLDKIPLNQWSHITILLIGKCDAMLFVNGIQVGERTRNSQSSERKIEDNVTMLLGRSHVGGRRTRGNYKGLLSSLDFWSRPLSSDEIMKHYELYRSAMSEPNPLLSLGLVHHVVPDSMRHCFGREYGASDLKNRVGVLRTSCPGPVGQPPHA